MDIMTLVSNDERIIVLTAQDERSIYTWNRSDTLQCWRPVVRGDDRDYPKGRFDPNDWEEVAILTQSGYGPKNYEEARTVAIAWHTDSLEKR